LAYPDLLGDHPVLLLFGGNRFSAMMGDVAKGLKSFKQGMADDEDDKPPPL
jgi:sec-independent protein translocase protein TatA